jgi:cyclohexa-1,5-dienecarbonyl-CoA hydratase
MQNLHTTTRDASTAFSRVALDMTAPPIARVTLANAPLNVIDVLMMEELSLALAEVESHPAYSVIVLQGAGKAFCAGVDVAAHTPDKVQEMLTKFHTLIKSLVASPKVTVAAVHGACLGGGAELALVCDLVFTADSAQWAFPEIKLGCFPPVACASLAAVIGQKAAADLILTGRSISGKEAAALRLANRSVPEEQLAAAVEEAVHYLRGLSPAALGVTKKAMYAWDSVHFDKGLARTEKIYLDELMHTEDAQEGIRAFLEKREPAWKGK